MSEQSYQFMYTWKRASDFGTCKVWVSAPSPQEASVLAETKAKQAMDQISDRFNLPETTVSNFQLLLTRF